MKDCNFFGPMLTSLLPVHFFSVSTQSRHSIQSHTDLVLALGLFETQRLCLHVHYCIWNVSVPMLLLF